MMNVCLAEFLKRPLPFPGRTNGIGSCYCTEMSTFKFQYLFDNYHVCSLKLEHANRASAAVLKCLKISSRLCCHVFFLKHEWTGLDKFNMLNEI